MTENEILTNCSLRFFKFDDECDVNLSRLDRLVTLQVDPNSHILFWRFQDKLIFKQKEISQENNYLFLDQIYDVRVGNPSNLNLNPSVNSYIPYILTIVYGSSITNLEFSHFVYLNKDQDTLQKFADQLFQLIIRVKNEEHGLLYHFRKKLAPKIYAAFTPRCVEEDIMKVFDRQKKFTTKSEWDEIRNLLSYKSRANVDLDDQKLIKIILILTRFEGSRLQSIFRKISNNEDIVDRSQFGEWIRKNQHDHRLNDARFMQITDNKIDSIFESWGYSKDNKINGQMFAHWIFSDECGTVISSKRMKNDVTSMREPINRYFINSSHNSYCSGNQLVYALGRCNADVEMYRQILLSGCRCVELDVWDNRERDQLPVVTHGPSAVMGMNEIPLYDVCVAIKECAFKSSPYPIILSIENHLGKKQQMKMVKIFRQVFGDLLLTSPLSNTPIYAESGKNTQFPSPEDLKFKILIKAKKKFENASPRSREETENDLLQQSLELTEDETIEHQVFKELSEEQREAQMRVEQEELSCSELSAIINYMQAYQSNRSISIVSNIENATTDPAHCIVSVDENVVWNCMRNNTVDKIQKLAKSKIVRVYPKASRIYSTNYSPMIHWLCGAQMVALNMQTNCSNLQLNYAMFDRNGGSGYVRKPDYLRFRDVTLRPFISIPFTIAYTVEVEVICAYFLSSIGSEKYRRRSSISIRLLDVPQEIEKNEEVCSKIETKINCSRRLKIKEENNFTTNYERQVHTFDKVMLNDLSFVQFNVHNESNSVIAQRVLHIETLNNGYRLITLRSPSNKCVGPASLLVRFDIFIHTDRKNLRDHKQMYNPHAFEKETDKWERRFSNPFSVEEEDGTQDDFLLVEGTRRGEIDREPPSPTNRTTSFANQLFSKFKQWKKK